MSVAIIDYGSGNLRSAAKSFERGVAEDDLNHDVIVTADPDQVRKASFVVLPGVGAFGDCRRGLMALDGMVEALSEAVI
ncbi:MAG TPA: imidazole glycerol phosphate synthase subunit HisH, partial [Rhodospirillales bacterium]|nr:imidazole glycerol phosphate synthase subunit HisH [Rhodospirillales bacterium]